MEVHGVISAPPQDVVADGRTIRRIREVEAVTIRRQQPILLRLDFASENLRVVRLIETESGTPARIDRNAIQSQSSHPRPVRTYRVSGTRRVVERLAGNVDEITDFDPRKSLGLFVSFVSTSTQILPVGGVRAEVPIVTTSSSLLFFLNHRV